MTVVPSATAPYAKELLARAAETWLALGLRPKHHLASQRRGARPGAHSERIPPARAFELISAMQHEADWMLEAKDKDLALLQLRAALARRGVTESLRTAEREPEAFA